MLIEDLFFQLIKVSLGKDVCMHRTPSNEEWTELYEVAQRQSLLGVCFAGVQKLQSQRQSPRKICI